MEIKDLLRTKRIEKGLTMKELADRVGVSEGTISRWESGEIASMKLDRIFAIADALGIEPTAIIKPKEEYAPTEKRMLAKNKKHMDTARRMLEEGADAVFDAYEIAPEKLVDYARMLCMASGSGRR